MVEAATGDQRDGPWANLLSSEALADPYGFLAALREEHGPVFWSGRHRAWLLTSYAEVAGGYRDDRLSSDRVGAIARHLDEARRAAMAPTLELLRGWMVFRDEPDHTRLRDPVRWAFTPKAMEGLRAQVQSLVDELVDGVVEAGTCDLVAAFAFPLPAMVIAYLLGVRRRTGTSSAPGPASWPPSSSGPVTTPSAGRWPPRAAPSSPSTSAGWWPSGRPSRATTW